MDEVGDLARSCPIVERRFASFRVEGQAEMPIDGRNVSRIQCVEHFQVRIFVSSSTEQGAQFLRPLDDEHRLEGGMAVFGIECLQDEATRLHAPHKKKHLFVRKGSNRCDQSAIAKATPSWAPCARWRWPGAGPSATPT